MLLGVQIMKNSGDLCDFCTMSCAYTRSVNIRTFCERDFALVINDVFFFSFRRVTIRTINSKSLNTFKLSHIKSWAHTDYSLSPRQIKRTQSSQVSANAIFLQLQRNLHDLYLLHRNFADADDFYTSSLLISSLKWVKNIPKIIREVSYRKMALAEKQQIIEKNKMSR